METGACSDISCRMTSSRQSGYKSMLVSPPAFHLISFGNSRDHHLWKSSSCKIGKCIFTSLPQDKWKSVISSPIAGNTKSKEANSLQWQLQKEFFFEGFFPLSAGLFSSEACLPRQLSTASSKPGLFVPYINSAPISVTFAKLIHICHPSLSC